MASRDIRNTNGYKDRPVPSGEQQRNAEQQLGIMESTHCRPEDRCPDYDADEYRYSPSVEPRILDAQGGIHGPYTGTWFATIKETAPRPTTAASAPPIQLPGRSSDQTYSTSRWHRPASTGIRRPTTTLPSGSQTSTSAGTSTELCRSGKNTT